MADLRGGARDARPPGPKFLHFHAVFGKNLPNNRLAPPPLGLAPPPLGNPGSATAKCQVQHNIALVSIIKSSSVVGWRSKHFCLVGFGNCTLHRLTLSPLDHFFKSCLSEHLVYIYAYLLLAFPSFNIYIYVSLFRTHRIYLSIHYTYIYMLCCYFNVGMKIFTIGRV